MGKMGPTVNIVVAHARLRLAGMNDVGNTLLALVDNMDLDASVTTADVLTLIHNLTRAYPQYKDTVIEMFTAPLA